MINYFAYGHNTNIDEMQRRIPGAKLLGTADLQGWEFVMEHYSNIVPESGSTVKGVLWSIPEESRRDLDYDEAYGKNYGHRMITVMHNSRPVRAMVYIMLSKYHNNKPPSRKYIDWIAAGYKANKIPLSQLIHALEDRIHHVRHAHGIKKKGS